jgi:CheY-like chemotaxis protein
MSNRTAVNGSPLGGAASLRVDIVHLFARRVTFAPGGRSVDRADPFLKSLAGRRILLVEDEFLVADEIMLALSELGITTIGPASTVERAIGLLKSPETVDAALLDVNLRGEVVFPLVDILRARRIPYVFLTGYDPDTIPEQYRDVAVCLKPVDIWRAMEELFG